MEKLAFIHIPRTSGGSINGCLMDHLPKLGYNVFNSRDTVDRDYDVLELFKFTRFSNKIYVHNHSFSWDEDIIDYFHEKGWQFFTTIRPLHDQLCSLFFFREKNPQLDQLDNWIRKALDDYLEICQIPPYWQKIDQIWHYGNTNLFMKFNFNVDIQTKYFVHKTASLGYNHYRTIGVISEKTNDLVGHSPLSSRYHEACRVAKGRLLL